MRPHVAWLLCLAGPALAAKTADETTLVATGNDAASIASVPTGSYVSYSTTMTVSQTGTGTVAAASSSMADANDTDTSTTHSKTTSHSVTLLVGGASTSTSTANGTATANGTSTTSSSAIPTNTQACNNYPEFCYRKYSNITEVCAHNSPFVKTNNAAANQALPVTTQLNDGVRMLQGQVHLINGTLRLCHSSCDILDAGPLVNYLKTVTDWIASHPYDVVSIILANARMDNDAYPLIGNFTDPIQQSGLKKYLYEPPKIPMALEDWPTLSEMILQSKRAVLFVDYNANQTEYPYILDEFSQIWETPYDPTNTSFPCAAQRPPGITPQQQKERMYLINHNLNAEISFAGIDLLVPATSSLDVTNGANGTGSLGLSANQCTIDYGRPPNFLLVDYYNYGSPNGSVFQVAANLNNVTYKGGCCGTTSAAAQVFTRPGLIPTIVLAVGFVFMM